MEKICNQHNIAARKIAYVILVLIAKPAKWDLLLWNDLTVIQVHAPTAMAKDSEIDEFYEKLVGVLEEQRISAKHRIVIMGDFNSQIGRI